MDIEITEIELEYIEQEIKDKINQIISSKQIKNLKEFCSITNLDLRLCQSIFWQNNRPAEWRVLNVYKILNSTPSDELPSFFENPEDAYRKRKKPSSFYKIENSMKVKEKINAYNKIKSPICTNCGKKIQIEKKYFRSVTGLQCSNHCHIAQVDYFGKLLKKIIMEMKK